MHANVNKEAVTLMPWGDVHHAMLMQQNGENVPVNFLAQMHHAQSRSRPQTIQGLTGCMLPDGNMLKVAVKTDTKSGKVLSLERRMNCASEA